MKQLLKNVLFMSLLVFFTIPKVMQVAAMKAQSKAKNTFFWRIDGPKDVCKCAGKKLKEWNQENMSQQDFIFPSLKDPNRRIMKIDTEGVISFCELIKEKDIVITGALTIAELFAKKKLKDGESLTISFDNNAQLTIKLYNEVQRKKTDAGKINK